MDHDQRNTLNVGFNGTLPWHAYRLDQRLLRLRIHATDFPACNIPATICPGHTTFDLSLGKSFRREQYTVSLSALNVANRRVQLDNSLTFGGFHWNDPRQIYVEFRYRFHY